MSDSNRDSAFVSGSLGCQSREAKEVEYDSANGGCFGAFERRRETSKRSWCWVSRAMDDSAARYREISDGREAEKVRLTTWRKERYCRYARTIEGCLSCLV